MFPFWLRTIGITVAISLLILMVLYVTYAGTRRNTRGRLRFGEHRGGRVRRARDLESGANTAGRNSLTESVDTLPRYTPGNGGGCGVPAQQVGVPPQQVHGSDGHGRVEEGEAVKPPPYTFDADGPVVEAGYGNAGGAPRGGGYTGIPLPPPPDAVYIPK